MGQTAESEEKTEKRFPDAKRLGNHRRKTRLPQRPEVAANVVSREYHMFTFTPVNRKP